VTGLADELGIRRSRTDPATRLVLKLLGTRPVARISARTLPHLDRFVLRLSAGRFTFSDTGLPTLFLTTTGARSGLSRTCQLVAVPVAGELAVIGSNFGQDRHPAWVHNVLAEPRAAVRYRGREAAVRVREATGEEADRIWTAADAVHPGFASYRAATDRPIKVFWLDKQ
jgi:deazaflavin-dependent oxidoreductase (nitroreductase family)